MAYRMTFLRIQCRGYSSGAVADRDLTAFKAESRRLFQELGWAVREGRHGVCDTATKDRQDLYLHPTSFSGVLEDTTVLLLQEHLSKAQTFQCYAVDRYEEYLDLSDEEYRSKLESQRDEITAFTLEQYRTERTSLYITDPVAEYIAEAFEICRLSDRERRNSVGRRFASELVAQLLQEGRLVAAETDSGPGIRSATAKELQKSSRAAEQVEGQITII